MADDKEKVPSAIGSLPGWVQVVAYVGVPSFIALFMLGAIPGLTSPIVAGIITHQVAMVEHERNDERRADALIRELTAICLRLPDKPQAPRCGG